MTAQLSGKKIFIHARGRETYRTLVLPRLSYFVPGVRMTESSTWSLRTLFATGGETVRSTMTLMHFPSSVILPVSRFLGYSKISRANLTPMIFDIIIESESQERPILAPRD